jgi:hypothetical protein
VLVHIAQRQQRLPRTGHPLPSAGVVDFSFAQTARRSLARRFCSPLDQ